MLGRDERDPPSEICWIVLILDRQMSIRNSHVKVTILSVSVTDFRRATGFAKRNRNVRNRITLVTFDDPMNV